jgi:inosine triphosphate pyrophosphatase
MITLVSGSKHKVVELQRQLGSGCSRTITHRALDLPELQGEPEFVAAEKCKLAALKIGGPVRTSVGRGLLAFVHLFAWFHGVRCVGTFRAVIEDTSLCFNALGGLPGVYVKWFVDKLTVDGLPKLLAAFEVRRLVLRFALPRVLYRMPRLMRHAGRTSPRTRSAS